MGQVRVGQVDLETGEIFDGAALAVIFPKRKNGFQTGWVAVAQNPMLELAKANLGGEANRVLFYVLAKLDFENWIKSAIISSDLMFRNQQEKRTKANSIFVRMPVK